MSEGLVCVCEREREVRTDDLCESGNGTLAMLRERRVDGEQFVVCELGTAVQKGLTRQVCAQRFRRHCDISRRHYSRQDEALQFKATLASFPFASASINVVCAAPRNSYRYDVSYALGKSRKLRDMFTRQSAKWVVSKIGAIKKKGPD